MVTCKCVRMQVIGEGKMSLSRVAMSQYLSLTLSYMKENQ